MKEKIEIAIKLMATQIPADAWPDQFHQNRLAILEGLAKGESALAEDRVMSHKQAMGKMVKWQG